MKHIAILAIALASATAAHAGRPLATEDAGVLERSECEVETYGANTRMGSADTTSLSSQLSCGIGRSTQLGAAIGRSRDDFGHANSFTLNGKTNLFKGEGSSASYTIAYGISAVHLSVHKALTSMASSASL